MYEVLDESTVPLTGDYNRSQMKLGMSFSKGIHPFN